MGLKIAIDCDNVLFHNHIPEQVILDLHLNADLSKIYHLELDELGKEGKQECYKRFSNPKYMCNLKPIRGNKNKIREWYRQGHELICVTARDLSIARATINMIKRHYPEILKIKLLNKKYHKIIKDYDKQKERHLEKLASKSLDNDENFRKLKDKKIKGDFLKNF